jgi:hypothetical protein
MPMKTDIDEAMALLGVPQSCRFTRSELLRFLHDCGYGTNETMYRVFFRKADDGNPLCSTCGLHVGHHADPSDATVAAVPVDATADGMTRRDEEVEFPPPDTTIEEYGSDPTLRLPENGAVAPYPLHWVGAAWYAPFVEFAGRSRNATPAAPSEPLKYRCTLEGCNQLFETEGALMNVPRVLRKAR